MSRKRNSLSQSISSLSASIPDIPSVVAEGNRIGKSDAAMALIETEVHQSVNLALGDDDTITAVATISPEGEIKVTAVGENPLDLFRAWSLTPEGHRVRDSRVPTDPVRLGCILDDNARIAFLAGYAAATPSFE